MRYDLTAYQQERHDPTVIELTLRNIVEHRIAAHDRPCMLCGNDASRRVIVFTSGPPRVMCYFTLACDQRREAQDDD